MAGQSRVRADTGTKLDSPGSATGGRGEQGGLVGLRLFADRIARHHLRMNRSSGGSLGRLVPRRAGGLSIQREAHCRRHSGGQDTGFRYRVAALGDGLHEQRLLGTVR